MQKGQRKSKRKSGSPSNVQSLKERPITWTAGIGQGKPRVQRLKRFTLPSSNLRDESSGR